MKSITCCFFLVEKDPSLFWFFLLGKLDKKKQNTSNNDTFLMVSYCGRHSASLSWICFFEKLICHGLQHFFFVINPGVSIKSWCHTLWWIGPQFHTSIQQSIIKQKCISEEAQKPISALTAVSIGHNAIQPLDMWRFERGMWLFWLSRSLSLVLLPRLPTRSW